MNLELQTKRFRLIPFDVKDSMLFLKLNNTDFVKKYLWDDMSISLKDAEDIMNQNRLLFKNHNYGLWKITLKENHQVVGYTGLWHFFEEAQPQLIYALLKAYTGQGIASESARAIINYASNKLGFDYLLAANDEANISSQKVAERIGMHFIERRLEDGKPTLFYKIDICEHQEAYKGH
ncbi:GNAT family N-acetyltransferase [Winogradskyella sp.]|uniref:GNAT family N-acetyltransferase n=1 Tax=Winogradskyella sp. TaxID=1883156 RepID=UPI003BAB770C